MDDADLRRGRRRIVAALPVLALAGCAAPRPAPPGAEPLPPPPLSVGERWRYGLVDLYNQGAMGDALVEVTATAQPIRLAVTPPGAPAPVEEQWADPWTVITDSTYGRPLRFETPMPVVPPGARAGQSMMSTTRYTVDGDPRRYRWQQRLRAVGWESVRVPAGTFEALRVERLIDFEHPDFFRLGSFRRDVVWYAPTVDRWVKREWTGDYMSGGPTRLSGRTLEERVRWQLLAHDTARR